MRYSQTVQSFYFLALIRAYEDQDLKELDKAIVKARSINDPSMKQPLTLASRLRDRLAAKNNLKDMILNADIRTIYELRKLVHPPDGVHQTIKAALMLLDCPRQEVEVDDRFVGIIEAYEHGF